MTYTYVLMEVSDQTYDEVANIMRTAGYDDVFHEHRGGEVGVSIDMHGVALVRAPKKTNKKETK